MRDCDGLYHHDYVDTFNDDEIAERILTKGVNDFSDIHFMNRVMTNVASPYAVQYGMTVTVDDDGIEVNEATDEGFRQASVRWCSDECDETQTAFRDFTAESMGY